MECRSCRGVGGHEAADAAMLARARLSSSPRIEVGSYKRGAVNRKQGRKSNRVLKSVEVVVDALHGVIR